MSKAFLRRYTDLPGLIYVLRERKITLLDPQSCDDSNDSHYLTLYKQKKRLGSVLALCFTQASETYHRWRVFANGASGVCITFNRTALEAGPRPGGGSGVDRPVDTAPKSVVTSMAGFAARRPQPPGGRTAIPAALR